MRCEKCGKPLEEGAFICTECGAKVYSSENEAAKSQPYADPDAQARFMSYMEQNQPSVQADPQQFKPKKKKGPIIAAVAAVLVVALGVGGVFAYPSILRSVAPQAYVNYAQKQADKALQKDMETLKNAWGSDLLKEIMSGVYSQTIKMDFKDISTGSPEADQILQNISANINTVKDDANKKMSASVEVGAMGTSVKAEGYLTEDELTLKIPTIMDAVKFSDKDFAANWNASGYVNYFGEMDSETKFDFADLFQDDKDFMWNPNNEFVKEMVKKSQDLIDNHSTLAKGPKAAVSGAGAQEYYQFIYTIDAEAYSTLVRDFTKDFFDLYFDKMNSYFLNVIDEQTITEATDKLKTELDKMSFDNVTVTVYVDESNRIVGEKVAFDLNDGNSVTNAAVDMLMRGQDSLLNDIYVNLTFAQDDDKMNLLVESKGNHTMKDGKFADETKFTVNENNEINTVTISTQWDTNLAENNLSVAIDIPSEDQKIEINGNYIVDQAQKKVILQGNRMKIQGIDDNSSDLKFNLYCEYAHAVPEDVKAITGDVKSLFDSETVQKVEELIMQFASQMNGEMVYGYDSFNGDDFGDEDFSDFGDEDFGNFSNEDFGGFEDDFSDFAA